MTQQIERDALKTLLDRDEPVTLVEALPSRYYEASHLPGAVNLPHDEVMNRAAYGGERFVITRHGKELAAIVPLEDATLLDRLRSLLEAKDYEAALREVAEAGTVPWDEVRRELDL